MSDKKKKPKKFKDVAENMKRATEKEDALNMAGGGGLMKYGHGGRGMGITKKGVKPCKMR